MLLVEGGGRTLLLTGDGRSQDIITGLEAIGKLPPFGTCEIDVMKVPHHGSARNAVGDLFERVRAKTYVLSADGRHGNPDDQTLNWLVEAACRQERDIRLVATNFTPSLARLVVNKPPEENHYTVEILPEGATSVVV
jgi:beta-lactamase superfamily II metal-dependent hydrolase